MTEFLHVVFLGFTVLGKNPALLNFIPVGITVSVIILLLPYSTRMTMEGTKFCKMI